MRRAPRGRRRARQEVLHLRPHGRYASRAHHAQARPRNTRRARDVRTRKRRHRPRGRLRATSPRRTSSASRRAAGAFIKKRYAEDHSLKVGSPLTVDTPTGKTLRLRVDGIFDEPKGGSPFGDVSISTATFDDSFATYDNEFTLLNIRGGPSDDNTAALKQALVAFPVAEVETRDEFKNGQLADLTLTLNILYALLGLSVIVSLFGVINTLVLSVFERTRELGMLRAIGMTRRQVRRMIRHESIVTALIGAALGIAVGIFLAVITTIALSD